MRAELWLVVKPVAQDYQGRNFDRAVELADNLESALFTALCNVGGVLGWSVDVTNRAIAGTMYWVVVADIRGGRW